MAQMRDARVTSRTGGSQVGNPGRRRAPYVLRACDACRRRKGKCDGRQPCRYCAGRNRACSYDNTLECDEWPLRPGQADRTEGQYQEQRTSSSPSSSCTQDAIRDLLSNLQEQLNGLASQVHTSSQTLPQPVFAAADSSPEDFLSSLIHNTPATEDYLDSLNLAQSVLHGGSLSALHPQQQFPDGSSAYDDAVIVENGQRSVQPPRGEAGGEASLLRFRSLISLQEAMRLMDVYQEVIGDLHPIVNIDEVKVRARSCYTPVHPLARDTYSELAQGTLENDLLIFNLALAIALHADGISTSPSSETVILESVKNAVNSSLAAPVSDIKQVTVVLLKGSYDFFNDMPQSAWRMCGIAGRMLMELGLHNGAMSKHVLNSQVQRAEVWTLMSSIVILDRQWSAAAGLPTNFHDSAFGPFQTSSIKVPYLQAMLSFILLSNKFNDPLSKATQAQRYNDEDAFELMNFQIERWLKKAVPDGCPTRPWFANPMSQPPTWKVLLSLRAESVRGLLFKPYFLSRADVQMSKQYVQPAIEVLFDVCNILYNLNMTDVYRKQQPFYQPLLSSTSGLGFVLTAFIEQNRAALLTSLSVETARAMGRSYEMAVALATGYAKTSKAARGLSEKLSGVRASLLGLGMLQNPNPEEGTQEGFRSNGLDRHLECPTRRRSTARPSLEGSRLYENHLSRYEGGMAEACGQESALTDISGADMGLGELLGTSWTASDTNSMCLSGVF